MNKVDRNGSLNIMLSVMVHLSQHSKNVFCKIHTVVEISQTTHVGVGDRKNVVGGGGGCLMQDMNPAVQQNSIHTLQFCCCTAYTRFLSYLTKCVLLNMWSTVYSSILNEFNLCGL
jgi:hypothetical protein